MGDRGLIGRRLRDYMERGGCALLAYKREGMGLHQKRVCFPGGVVEGYLGGKGIPCLTWEWRGRNKG